MFFYGLHLGRLGAQGIAANINYDVSLWTSLAEEEWIIKALLHINIIMFFFGLLWRKNGSLRHCCLYTLLSFFLERSPKCNADGIAAYIHCHIFLGTFLVTLSMIGKARENRGLGLETMNIHFRCGLLKRNCFAAVFEKYFEFQVCLITLQLHLHS